MRVIAEYAVHSFGVQIKSPKRAALQLEKGFIRHVAHVVISAKIIVIRETGVGALQRFFAAKFV